MKVRALQFALLCILLPTFAAAQNPGLKLPDFGSLSGKAIESVNISLNPWLLHMMAGFVDDKDADGAATKKLLGGIKSVQVRSFEFATDFAYSIADIDAVRQQLAAPGWSRLMQVHNRDKNEDMDMYVLVENDRTTGFALISSEPRQFTIINIVGSISVEDLPKLQNQLHLPKMSTGEAKLLM